MIRLHRVSVLAAGRKPFPILKDVSATFPTNARIGILAAPGTGKSTFAKHLSGLEKPKLGQIEIHANVSWPIGLAGFLHPHLSLAQNLRTIALLRGIWAKRYIAWCLNFSELHGHHHLKVSDLTPSERATLAYASVICLPWDMLIADETITVGTPTIRMKCDAMLEEHRAKAGLIFLSRSPARLKEYCDDFFVLIDGRLKRCPDPEVGLQALTLVRQKEEALLDV